MSYHVRTRLTREKALEAWTTAAAEVGSRLLGMRWVNHQVKRPAVAESNGGEVTHVARCQTADAKGLGERDNRRIDEAQAEIGKASIHFHRT